MIEYGVKHLFYKMCLLLGLKYIERSVIHSFTQTPKSTAIFSHKNNISIIFIACDVCDISN